jgi:hypothetical protein
VILSTHSLNQYVIRLAKALDTRGFDVERSPIAEFDESGIVVFSVTGAIGDRGAGDRAEIILEEVWRPLAEHRWERRENTYDLVDRPRRRRRAFHLHDRDLAEAVWGATVHEHCEEVLGQPTCGHYLGRELPDGYLAIELLMAAWVEPGHLDCSSLICLS